LASCQCAGHSYFGLVSFFVKDGCSTSVPVIVKLVVSLLCLGRSRLANCQCADHSYLGLVKRFCWGKFWNQYVGQGYFNVYSYFCWMGVGLLITSVRDKVIWVGLICFVGGGFGTSMWV
jgi:hypothetical protein